MQDAINPIAVAGAEGRHFWDYDGKRYLDFASQLVNVSIGRRTRGSWPRSRSRPTGSARSAPPFVESRSRLDLLAEVTPAT